MFPGASGHLPWCLWSSSLVPLIIFPGISSYVPWYLWSYSPVPPVISPSTSSYLSWCFWSESLSPLVRFPGALLRYPSHFPLSLLPRAASEGGEQVGARRIPPFPRTLAIRRVRPTFAADREERSLAKFSRDVRDRVSEQSTAAFHPNPSAPRLRQPLSTAPSRTAARGYGVNHYGAPPRRRGRGRGTQGQTGLAPFIGRNASQGEGYSLRRTGSQHKGQLTAYLLG